jgi:hypothetical protein
MTSFIRGVLLWRVGRGLTTVGLGIALWANAGRVWAAQLLAAGSPPLSTVNAILRATESEMDRAHPKGLDGFSYPAVGRVEGDWAIVTVESRVRPGSAQALVAYRRPSGWQVVWGPERTLGDAEDTLRLLPTLLEPCPSES